MVQRRRRAPNEVCGQWRRGAVCDRADPYSRGECLTGVNEGSCDVLSIDKQPDGHVICYTYGDFCSHEATRSSRITVENGEMLITDTAQYGGL